MEIQRKKDQSQNSSVDRVRGVAPSLWEGRGGFFKKAAMSHDVAAYI